MLALPRLRTWSFSLALSALLFALSREGRACSPADCQLTTVSVVDLVAIPTNVPAFLIQQRLMWGMEEPPLTDLIAVESASGEPVPFHLESTDAWTGIYDNWTTAVIIDDLLDPGWYYFKFPEYCPRWWLLEEPVQVVRAFEAIGPLLPYTEAPTVYPGTHQVENIIVSTVAGSCVAEISADTYRFSIGHPDLGNWNSLVRIETLVDGARWAISELGYPDLGYTTSDSGPFSRNWGLHRPTVLHSMCGVTDYTPHDAGLTPGKHHVEVRMLVYGFAYDYPTAEFDIEMGCPPEADETEGAELSPEPLADLSGSIEIVEHPADEAIDIGDATNTEADGPAQPDDKHASGCGASPASSASPVLLVLLLPLAVARVRLKRPRYLISSRGTT